VRSNDARMPLKVHRSTVQVRGSLREVRRTFTEFPASRLVRREIAVPAFTAQSGRGSGPATSCSGNTNGKWM
jgi:hypothetical protein